MKMCSKHDMTIPKNRYTDPNGYTRCQGCRRDWQREYNRKMREALRLVEGIRNAQAA